MPYLILAVGLLIGLYALYRFFLNADVKEVKAFFKAIFVAAIVLALILMALTGRLAAALGLFIALLPFIVQYLRHRQGQDKAASPPSSGVMSQKEALEVLGLPDGASQDDIQNAYKKLMMKVHPDSEGSDWLASKLNQARDTLQIK